MNELVIIGVSIAVATIVNVIGAAKKGYTSTSDIALITIGSLVCWPLACYSVLVRVDKTLCTRVELDDALRKVRPMIRYEIKRALDGKA